MGNEVSLLLINATVIVNDCSMIVEKVEIQIKNKDYFNKLHLKAENLI